MDLSQLQLRCGTFVREGKKDFKYFDSSSKKLKHTPSLTTRTIDGVKVYSLKVEIENLSGKDLKINAINILDTDIPEGNITKVLKNDWTQSGFSGYVGEYRKTHKAAFFLQREQNPFSFLPEFGYLKGGYISEWYSQIVTKNGSIFVGAVTIDRCFSVVYAKKFGERIHIRVTCQFDGKTLKKGEKLTSEEIVVLVGKTEDTKSLFAKMLAERYPLKKDLKKHVGVCCAYYYQGNSVNEKYVLDTLEGLKKIRKKFPKSIVKYVEIDAGYCEWGDWLNTTKAFPSGIEKVAREIKEAGFEPGIWLSPFVSTSRSRLYREHKDWFIKVNGKPLQARMTTPFDNFPVMGIYVLDVTKPIVLDYLSDLCKYYSKIGFTLFKLDFLYPSCFTEDFSNDSTRVEAFRNALTIIRKAVGRKAILTTAITQLSPILGIVDVARISIDTTNPMVYGIPGISSLTNNYMITRSFRNYESRKFLDGKVWYADVDCIVTNPLSGLTKKNLRKHIELSKECKSRWLGDRVDKISKTEMEMIKEVLE